MRLSYTIRIVGLSALLLAGLAACGKAPENTNTVNGNGNENVNASENVNAAVPDVNGNSNENVNATENSNVNANPDLDNDGLTNDQERTYKTDPLNADTDADGYNDGLEVATGYDPTKIPDEDPKVISQLKPVNTPGVPPPVVRSTPLVAGQSFPFSARKEDGAVTIRLESRVAYTNVNYALDFAGGAENKGPTLTLDAAKLQLLKGNFEKGRVWQSGKNFTKGAHFIATANSTGTLTVFPAPTPPYSISGNTEGGSEDVASQYLNTFVADFPKNGQYKFELGVIKGQVKIAVENTDLVLNQKVYKEIESIKSQTITADVAEGVHTISITCNGIASWSLRVSKI